MPDATDKPILLCYDGSEDAFRAIEFAGSLFAGRSALVLSVWEHYTFLSGIPRVEDSLVIEATAALAADGCERAADAGLVATPLVAPAPPESPRPSSTRAMSTTQCSSCSARAARRASARSCWARSRTASPITRTAPS